jgi:hypothetical protein
LNKFLRSFLKLANSMQVIGNSTNPSVVYPIAIKGNTVSGTVVDLSPPGRAVVTAIPPNHDWHGAVVPVTRTLDEVAHQKS